MTTYRIWAATNGPDTDANDEDPYTLGVAFRATSVVWVTEIHYYRGTSRVVAPTVAAIFRHSTQEQIGGNVTLADPGESLGWITTTLPEPIALSADIAYRAAVLFPNYYTATAAYFTTGAGSAGVTTGILTAPSSGATSGGNGTFNAGSSLAFPGTNGSGANYWIDVTVSDVDPVGGITLAVTDNAGGVDAAGQAGVFLRGAADGTNVADSPAQAGVFPRSSSDGVGLAESTVLGINENGIGLTRTVGEVAGLTDTGGLMSVDVAESLTEMVGLADSFSVVLAAPPGNDHVRLAADAVGLVDAAQARVLPAGVIITVCVGRPSRATIPSTTQEYINIPIVEWGGTVEDPTTLEAEIAITTGVNDPADGDYVSASWITEEGIHKARVLWRSAVEEPEPRTVYRAWLRLNAEPETPVLLAGQIKTL